jgi:hypothetical protein
MTHDATSETRIEQQHQQLSRELAACGPIMRGSLIERFTVCSRAGCRCLKGKKHGPYLYLSVFDGKRSRLVYIPQNREPEVRAWVQNYQKLSEILAKLSDLSVQRIRLPNTKTSRPDPSRPFTQRERKASR